MINDNCCLALNECYCLHLGHGNPTLVYKLGNINRGTTRKEKDLGVAIDTNLKVSGPCETAALKANRILGLIRGYITYKEEEIIIALNESRVNPYLEYCIQAW